MAEIVAPEVNQGLIRTFLINFLFCYYEIEQEVSPHILSRKF